MVEYNSKNHGKVEMPVSMALMMAQDGDACEAFASLEESRRLEYISRAKTAMNKDQMKNIVNDIKTIG